MQVRTIIDKLYNTTNASREELLFLLDNLSEENKEYLIEKSHEVALKNYGNNVYVRGLIEFTNYCIRDCRYCGIRKSNDKADRYRLTIEEILECADIGDRLGYKTYVLQGGEDPYFTDEKMVEIIKKIKEKYPNNAITLSLGERSYKSYEHMFNAGADRYLLRHETASKRLYEALHPNSTFENRIQSNVREKYSLYDGKICTGDEAAECRACIERRINNAGFNLEITRGDSLVLSDKERKKINNKLINNKNNEIMVDNIFLIN